MKVAAYIPIKLNNERMPEKNTKVFGDGTPLCSFMFRTLSKAEGIDQRYCFCSDKRITAYLPSDIKFLKRDASLDSSETQCQEIVRSFLEIVDADIIVLCHATCPFVKINSIETCIKKVKSGKYDSAFTAVRVQDFLWQDGRPLNFEPNSVKRTQDLPKIYKESVGCYVFTKELFLSSGRRVGIQPYICEVDAFEAVDIDYAEDFEIANAIYMNILKHRMEGN